MRWLKFNPSVPFNSLYGHFGMNEGVGASNRFKNIAASAMVGGIASSLGGGKFKNGAVSGAFSRLFNEMSDEYAEKIRMKLKREGYNYSTKQIQKYHLCHDNGCVDRKEFFNSIFDAVNNFGDASNVNIDFSPNSSIGLEPKIDKVHPVIRRNGDGDWGAEVGIGFRVKPFSGEITTDIGLDNAVDMLPGSPVTTIRGRNELPKY